MSSMPSVGVEAVDDVDGSGAGDEQQAVARDGELGDHVVTLGDDRLPRVGATPQHVSIERDTDDPAVRRIEVGDADERHPVGADRERGGGVDPGDHGGPVVVAAIEHVDVGALVADLDVDDRASGRPG